MAPPLSRSILCTFFALLVFPLPILGAPGSSPLLGGWRPIDNPNDAAVVKIAKFAVAEHNKEAKTSLVFKKVVKGDQQVVAGMKYRLVISAADGSASAAPKTYKAVVYSRPWENFLKLISFKVFLG